MLTGLELMFMGVTRSNSGLFSALGFIVSPVVKRERRGKKKQKKEKGRREKGNRKGMEGRKEEVIKKDQRKDKKKEF